MLQAGSWWYVTLVLFIESLYDDKLTVGRDGLLLPRRCPGGMYFTFLMVLSLINPL